VPQVGIINPSEFSPANSIEVVIWVAVGGRSTLYGAVLGAILVNYLKSYFTGALPDAWLFVLGGLFVGVTLFLPKGIVGMFASFGLGGRDGARSGLAAWLARIAGRKGMQP
jgi:urea transport system permease protein